MQAPNRPTLDLRKSQAPQGIGGITAPVLKGQGRTAKPSRFFEGTNGNGNGSGKGNGNGNGNGSGKGKGAQRRSSRSKTPVSQDSHSHSS